MYQTRFQNCGAGWTELRVVSGRLLWLYRTDHISILTRQTGRPRLDSAAAAVKLNRHFFLFTLYIRCLLGLDRGLLLREGLASRRPGGRLPRRRPGGRLPRRPLPVQMAMDRSFPATSIPFRTSPSRVVTCTKPTADKSTTLELCGNGFV